VTTTIVQRTKVIDCDTHVVEPYDLWTSRVSVKRWGDLVPHVRWDPISEQEMWYFGDKPVAVAAGMAMAGYDRYPPDQPTRFTETQPYTWDARERLKLMDEYGIYAQVLYPNVSGFGMGRFTDLSDPKLMLACVQAYNDFLVDFSSAAPERFVPIMALPFWDVTACSAEMVRCGSRGHKGIVFGSQPELFGQPTIGDRHWDPVFAQAQEMDLSINFHIASGKMTSKEAREVGNPANGRHANFAKTSVSYFLGNSNAISEIIVSGLCHRYPRLKFVSVESGVGWIPFLLEALDWQWKNCAVTSEHPEYDMLPSEYFRRQIYSCFWFETAAVEAAIEILGSERILYETDFPHSTSMSPGPASVAVVPGTFIEANLGALEPSALENILHGNAHELYNLKC
jgi:uncharacterized protein